NGAHRTFHYFKVHVEDLGEPGSQHGDPGANCPPLGSNCAPADCGCLDFYHFTLYRGYDPAVNPTNGQHIDPNLLPHADSDKIYEVYGYTPGGNFQIHPALGDLNGNQVVNQADLNILLANLGPVGIWGIGDLNFDGMVDSKDIAVLLDHWGP